MKKSSLGFVTRSPATRVSIVVMRSISRVASIALRLPDAKGGGDGSGRDHAHRPDALSTWRAAVAGESGVDFIQSFDASEFPVRIAGEVKGFDASSVAPPKEARRIDRNVLLALGAAQEAWRDAALSDFDPARVGIVVGSAIGGLPGIVEQQEVLRERGPDRVSPFFIPSVLVDSASGQIAISPGPGRTTRPCRRARPGRTRSGREPS